MAHNRTRKRRIGEYHTIAPMRLAGWVIGAMVLVGCSHDDPYQKPLTAVLPYPEGGKIRIIAVASAERHPAVPEVPTIAESGLPDFEVSGWFGVFAPARTPAAIVSLLNYEINKALASEGLQRAFAVRGLLAAPGSAEQFRALIEKDRERWARLLKTITVR